MSRAVLAAAAVGLWTSVVAIRVTSVEFGLWLGVLAFGVGLAVIALAAYAWRH